jgi:spore germination cell wall hydrolase CwlJ-like protein
LAHAEITGENFAFSQNEIYEASYTEDDLLWLARIVEAETGPSASIYKKSAVANIVLNRVADPRFPNTIYEVIYQRNQFPPAYYSKFATLVPSQNSYLGAERALLGLEAVPDCLYFNYIPFKDKADDFYKLIEGDYFYY